MLVPHANEGAEGDSGLHLMMTYLKIQQSNNVVMFQLLQETDRRQQASKPQQTSAEGRSPSGFGSLFPAEFETWPDSSC